MKAGSASKVHHWITSFQNWEIEVYLRPGTMTRPDCENFSIRLAEDSKIPDFQLPASGFTMHSMGMMKPAPSNALYTKTQQRVLGLMLGNPDRSYSAGEIVRFAAASIGTVQRELESLALVGILTVHKAGAQKHYRANRRAPIFEELCGIVLNTFGVADVLRAALAPLLKYIGAAFIYGPLAKGIDSAHGDIDVMIIGTELSYTDVIPHVIKAQNRIGRSINPSLYTAAELGRKLAIANRFVVALMNQPKIFLIGSERDLPKLR